MTGLVSAPRSGLSGDAVVPGDKSISHRALIIGAIAVGETRIAGLLEGDDVLRTAAALRLMGVEAARAGDGVWQVFGVGVGGLAEPDDVLDLGNSGTGARLLMGLVATHPFVAHFTGDASLRSRPMARIREPVERMGARVIARSGGRMPLAVLGTAEPIPIEYALPVPSAQVKSATLLAGLNAPGITRVVETQPSRDHTELMLCHFGADIAVEDRNDGTRVISLTGQPELTARQVAVPADPSSAVFPGVCALVTEGSEITARGVGLNPLRAGVFETLVEMGADIVFANRRVEAGEPVADLTFRSSKLRAADVPAERAPSMIDEYPILSIAAACAEGTTRMRGLAELRVKESDRLGAMVAGLEACGVRVREEGDDLMIEGAGGPPPGGGAIRARSDHRIAMSFLVLGAAAKAPVSVDDDTHIATSFPGFVALMNRLGAGIERSDG